MSAVHNGYGSVPKNSAALMLEVSETPGGPVVISVHNLGGASMVLAASRKTDGAPVALAEETAVSAEASGFTGNGATLAFTGQSLNNTPIVPGTVRLTPATSGVDLVDGGDGHFYTDDIDVDDSGTINYFTGAMVLAYPAGKAPDGAIAANYNYSVLISAYGKKTFTIPNLLASTFNETLVVKAAGSDPTSARVEAYQPS